MEADQCLAAADRARELADHPDKLADRRRKVLEAGQAGWAGLTKLKA